MQLEDRRKVQNTQEVSCIFGEILHEFTRIVSTFSYLAAHAYSRLLLNLLKILRKILTKIEI